jgi:hypothetical protein
VDSITYSVAMPKFLINIDVDDPEKGAAFPAES